VPDWLNIGVTGTGCWPSKETSVTVAGRELILKPETQDAQQSAHIELRGITEGDAFTLLNRFLSLVSWCSEQPLKDRDGFVWRPPAPVPKQPRMRSEAIEFTVYREITHSRRLSQDIWIIRAAAEYLIESKFKISRDIFAVG
jgi:hypothetical protein